MSEKIVVPEGMRKSATRAWLESEYEKPDVIRISLEAALRWLSENPIVPTDTQAYDLWQSQILSGKTHSDNELAKLCAVEWQRRMFLAAPEPEIPPEIDPQKCPHRWQAKDDLTTAERVIYCELCGWVYSRTALEAFNRGRRLKQ